MRPIRRDDATHPRELPDPADEEAFFLGQRARELPLGDGEVRFNHNSAEAIEAVQRELNAHPAWREGDPCALCGEPEDAYDPIGHFVDPANASAYVMAHGQCGVDAGLRLA